MRTLLLLVSLAGAAYAQPRAGKPAPADAQLGRRVFQSRCASCHGDDGRGSATVAKRSRAFSPDSLDLTSERLLSQDDAALARGIRTGHGGMKGFGASLSPKETAAVVAYIRQLGHARAGYDSGRRQARADL